MNSGMLGLPGILNPYIANTPYDIWYARLLAAGGSVTGRSQATAYALWLAMSNRSYYSKIIYFMPFLGGNLAAATVPLIDTLGYGPCVSVAFLSTDFSETTGLQGNGTTKYFTSPIQAKNLNGNLGGLGWWENNYVSGSNVEPIGCNDNSPDLRISLDLRTNLRDLRWGNTSTTNGFCGDTASAGNAHYYGQKIASNSRTMSVNGAQIVATSTTETSAQANPETFDICGCSYNTSHFPWPGRGACAYLTNGQLTTQEITDLHNDINAYLITALGR